uniref:Uncharacterized protein n=1 Tax=Tetranychus urticae TaxID=32264 RepID=T1KQD9_TETUR
MGTRIPQESTNIPNLSIDYMIGEITWESIYSSMIKFFNKISQMHLALMLDKRHISNDFSWMDSY